MTLDNGPRWKANPETSSGIANMVSRRLRPPSGDPQPLKTLPEQELGLIFVRCTWTGEVHEQLHNYLVPIHRQLREYEVAKA